ncbi:MAG: NADH-quinone oxidoreductase subunit N [Candidatus Neomarinimicrobiota bacterium]
MDNLQSIQYFWPELIIVFTLIITIFVDFLYSDSASYRTGYWSLAGLVISSLVLSIQGIDVVTTLFRDMLAYDPFALFFKVIIAISTIFIILVSLSTNEYKNTRVGEHFILILVMVLGMMLMVSSIDLIMVYLAIETVSISSFILAGYLKSERRSSESSLKYVIYGAFSSGLMLFGLSILFGLTGTTKIFEIREVLINIGGDAQFAIILAGVFILAGFGYKISAVPFHFWTPDVYEGAPTPITAYLSVAPKAAGFALIIRFFHTVFTDTGALTSTSWLSQTALPWPEIMAILAVITMTLGNLVAIQQDNVKRMLAYSSIAHAGYMLMAIPMLSGEGIQAIMLYMLMYLMMNLGAFFVVIVVKNKTGGETFEDFKGFGWKMPVVGVIMSIFMFSLIGLPPTAGFIGKFYLFAAVIKAGPGFYWLAVIGVINSVISLYYYMRVVRMMFLEGSKQEQTTLPGTLLTVLLICLAVPTLLLGIYWAPVSDWVRNSLMFFTQGL